ncbi:MAG: peptidase T, partial [Proteobacteria bacterium]|nr:peptidase T [Pseudomonadota bacterium]
MRPILLAMTLGLFCLGAAQASPAPVRSEHRTGYDYYVIGDPATPRRSAVQPGYMLNGGGQWLRGAWSWFGERSGHGNLVILRASGDDELARELFRDLDSFASVQTLVFHGPAAASDPAVLDIVRH